MSTLLDVFNDRTANFSQQQGKSEHLVGNLFTLLGDNNKFIAGTYKALLKRPELFGSNASTLLYALDVGQSFKKDALYIMFQGFLERPPTTTESNIMFTWAEHLRTKNEFIEYEPVMNKLNSILKAWFADKTIVYNGEHVPLSFFRPILYNAAGVNVIELLPYIAYLFTYHIYGMPMQFSDAMSSSSLRSYIASLEDWFAKCYNELYSETAITAVGEVNEEIDDTTWEAFYDKMLDSSKIVELRNEEIRKTKGLLEGMIQDQQSINDADLSERYSIVLKRLVDIAIEMSPINKIIDKIPGFDPAYYDSAELANITSYVVSKTNFTAIIDSNDNYRYMLAQSKQELDVEELAFSKPTFDLNVFQLGLQRPFCSSDIASEIFKGYIRSKFEAKRSYMLDDSPIYLTSSDLESSNLYPFLLGMFVNGVWALEFNEMKEIMKTLIKKDEVRDFFNLHKLLVLIHGHTTQSILAPIYIISLLNSFVLQSCNLGQELSSFNPYIYLRQVIVDEARVIKLQNMLYSTLILNNKQYKTLVNNANAKIYEILTSKPIVIMPYVQTIADAASIYALGGCDCYRFLKYSNPITRGYGFISRTMNMNEELYVAYLFSAAIKNETVFEMITDENADIVSIRNNLATASKKEVEPEHLFKYEFKDGSYTKRPIGSFVDIEITNGESSINPISILLNYSMPQSEPKNVLANEVLRVKRLTEDDGSFNSSIPSTANGFNYKSNFISLKLNSNGSVKYLPIYNVASKTMTRNVAMIKPDGRRLIEIHTPLFNGQVNNVYWIYTDIRKESKFEKQDLKESGFQPRDGTFMLTDRIQPIPK